MRFANPWGLILIIGLLILGYWAYRRKIFARAGFVPVGFWAKIVRQVDDKGAIVLRWLKFATLLVLSVALLRPQWGKGYREVEAKVIDIMLVLDISGSMLAMDMGGETRIDAAKEEAIRFIEEREGDRIGLVLFASKTFLQCPLTTDQGLLKKLISDSQVGMIEDGTAIGSAIVTAINHIKDVPGKSKVIVLLTDGVNNAGKVDPITAAKLAKKLGIKIYTIGVGSDQEVVPFLLPNSVFGQRVSQGHTELDEGLLKEIANITAGKYFRVRDKKGMRDVFKQIDSLEKHKIKEKRFYIYKDVFPNLLKLGLFLLIIVVLLEDLVLVVIPQ